MYAYVHEGEGGLAEGWGGVGAKTGGGGGTGSCLRSVGGHWVHRLSAAQCRVCVHSVTSPVFLHYVSRQRFGAWSLSTPMWH